MSFTSNEKNVAAIMAQRACGLRISLGSLEVENALVRRGEHVKSIRLDKRCRLRALGRDELRADVCARVDGLDQPRIFDSHMHQPACRIKEGRVRNTGQLPFALYLSGLEV